MTYFRHHKLLLARKYCNVSRIWTGSEHVRGYSVCLTQITLNNVNFLTIEVTDLPKAAIFKSLIQSFQPVFSVCSNEFWYISHQYKRYWVPRLSNNMSLSPQEIITDNMETFWENPNTGRFYLQPVLQWMQWFWSTKNYNAEFFWKWHEWQISWICKYCSLFFT